MKRTHFFFGTLLLVFCSAFLVLAVSVDAAHAAVFDADGDGYIDTIETNLGSDPNDILKTPESVAIPASCFDEEDNDGDGLIDSQDPGCQPPPLVTDFFPPAGVDAFDSQLTLSGYDFAVPGGTCTVDFEGYGPTVIRRDDPVDDILGKTIDAEIVAMQLTGTGNVSGTSCPLPAGKIYVTLAEDPVKASTGQVQATGCSVSGDFPAQSFFDVYFQAVIDSLVGPEQLVVPGGPPGGPAGNPVRVVNRIGSIPPYYSPGRSCTGPGLNPDCYAVGGQQHLHCPMAPLDHFKCYDVKTTAVTVDLTDRWGEMTMEVKPVMKPKSFCNPVNKNGQAIADENAHLTCYPVKAAKGQPTFTPVTKEVRNQFGLQSLTVKKPVTLCLPTQKDPLPPPAALDHFKCYQVSGKAFRPQIAVTLVDQFHTEQSLVLKPDTLCTRVAKTVGSETTPATRYRYGLVCYKIKDAPGQPKFNPLSVLTCNQFGVEPVGVEKADTLCVPSDIFG